MIWRNLMVKTMENFNARENHGTKMEESGSYSVESMWIWQNVEHKASFDRSPTPYIPKAHSGKKLGVEKPSIFSFVHGPLNLATMATMVCGTFHYWRHTSFVEAYLLNRSNTHSLCEFEIRRICSSTTRFLCVKFAPYNQLIWIKLILS